jgi:signal transduction histidine kinase/DNA-binding response OmpR family regulator
VRDGIAHNNFRQNAYYKGNSGFFYFGGLNGLTIFKPKDIEINDVLSKSIITGISVNNNRVKIGEKVSGKVLLPESVFETKRIAINHRVKVISFHVAAQQSSTPLKNKVAHKLEGFDDDWIINERGKYTITYTSLPPGEYNLQVKSANSDGIWNNEITDLEINVLPPWYKTWWSYTIFMLIVIGASIVVFLYLIRLEKLKQRLIFEQIDKKRIDSVNEGKLRFFTSISHELRTPLTLIAGPLEKIIDRNKDEINKKYLFSIQNNAKRLLSLVDQLITFRQAEKGHLNVNIVSDTLGKFIYPITEVFEDYAIQQNINFFYKINSPNEKVFVDPEKTERIIYNLLSNSFKYTPPHGNISIETDLIPKDGKKMISIKVVDSGKGIPADKLEKIFEYFYQIEGREENVGGAGIGLAFCKSLIELMGGSITVESEPNKRTCFFVLMPSLEDLVTDNMKLLSSGKSFIKDWIPKPITDEYGQTEKIDKEPGKYSLLIVEDDLDVREFLKSELKEEYKLVLAKDGLDGLNKIRQNIPDLVISDVMMPEMNGFELCKKIKSDVETFHIPVILLTALGDSNSAVKGLEFGADDYISKPFSPKYLEIRIKKLIENNKRIKEYFSKHSNIPDKTIEMSNRDKEFLNQVVEAIEKNLADSSFGVEELATEIQYSASQLYRRLKKITGQVPNVYLRNFRLQHAAELLKSKEGYTVAEVMYQIGIESKSYFATSFKKLFGKSPSEFAK